MYSKREIASICWFDLILNIFVHPQNAQTLNLIIFWWNAKHFVCPNVKYFVHTRARIDALTICILFQINSNALFVRNFCCVRADKVR